MWTGLASPTCDDKKRAELPQEDFDDLVKARALANISAPAIVICHRYILTPVHFFLLGLSY